MFICIYVYVTNTYKPYVYKLIRLYAMTKRRTTVVVDDDLWKRFLSYIVKKHGTAKKASVEVENAVREYLNRHEKKL